MQVEPSPSSRFRTVSRRDPEFSSYLDGSFSDEFRALPVRSLNVDTGREEVTFEIRSLAEIAPPSHARIWRQLARPAALALSAGPMLATLAHVIARGDQVQSLAVAVTAFLGVLSFHIAMNLFNDYGDHIRGRDRVRPQGGSRVIQKGWIAAAQVRRAAWGLTALALLLGIPAILAPRSPLPLVAAFAGFAALEFAFQNLRLKYRGWTELMAFLLTGPCLTCAYAWALTGSVSASDVLLGGIFGAISLMYFHCGNFENIMTDSQAGVRTWATRAGFDASKRFFYFTAALIAGSVCAFALGERDARWWPAVCSVIALLYAPVSLVRQIASPLSSQLSKLRAQVLWLAWSITGILVVTALAIAWMRG